MSCVLFLDVQGVIAHRGSDASKSGDYGSSFWYADQIDPACVKRVLEIVEATGAKIVIISEWRLKDDSCVGIQRAFQRVMPEGTRGRTLRNLVGSTTGKGANRGEEISTWLKANPEYNRHVVIDDNWVGGGHPQICPSFNEGGLLDSHVAEAIEILTRE